MANGAGQPADPCVMVIFGASGDLTQRKLIRALYNLSVDGLLTDNFAVIGVSRRPMSDEEYRARLGDHLRDNAPGPIEEDVWKRLSERIYYRAGDVENSEMYESLARHIAEIDQRVEAQGNVFFYLATAPQLFLPIVEHLGRAGLALEEKDRWRRVIIEKPFGRDLDSARSLNREISKVLGERQIYRIDHYLGKETVQNILVFRFSNGIFEPLWNHRYIDHVQITVAEQLGVEQRGGYYESSGALRDMVPNHIFQLISLTAMEPPISFDADAVRDEQAKALRALQPMAPEEVLRCTIRGQYGEGRVRGEKASAYRSEPGVDPQSATETYVAMKLALDNWRWAGVPIYLRTGKRLPCRATEIAIEFKQAPFMLFRHTGVDRLTPNRLILRLQPDEGISLSFGAKIPGPVVRLGEVDMDFQYEDYFGATPSTGYERLLYDCMLGDATLFQRADMTEASWRVVAPMLDLWKALPPRDFPNYAAGSWGPAAADELLGRDGRSWIRCGGAKA